MRQEEGLSAQKFADRLTAGGYSVSDVAVLKYEAPEGTKKIPGDYLAAVCRVFTRSPAWLLMGTEPRRPSRPSVDQRALVLMDQLMDAWRLGDIPEIPLELFTRVSSSEGAKVDGED